MLARKLTLALHYRYVGRPLSKTGKVWFTFYFNFDALNGGIGDHVAALLDVAKVDEAVSFGGELSIGHAEADGVHEYAISIRDRMLITSFSSEDPLEFSRARPEDLHGPFAH